MTGKTVLVTGGTRGIGRAIVAEFIQAGATAHYLARNPADAQDYFASLNAPGTAVFHQVDVSNEPNLNEALDDIVDTAGVPDVVVNNAGVTRDGLIMRMSTEDWETVLRVNLTSAFLISRHVIRKMIKRKSGAIINVSSVVGLMGNGGQANYAASKAGLIGFTKSLAREVASRNIRVNAVAPGFIDTDMTGALTEDQRAALKAQIPMGRIGQPEEVARVCRFLASEDAAYITGEVVTVGGGLGM